MKDHHPSPEDEAISLENRKAAEDVSSFLEEHLTTGEMRDLLKGNVSAFSVDRLSEIRALVTENFPDLDVAEVLK